MSNNEQKNVYQIVDEKLITVMEDVTQKVKDTSGEISLATSKYAKFYTVPDYSSQEQFKDTYTYNTLGKQEVMEFTTDFNGYIKQEYKTNANSNTYISLDNSYASVYVNNICILNIQLKKGITTWTFPVKKGDYVQTYVKTGYDGQDGCDFFKAYKIPFSLTIPSIETLPSGSSGSQGETGADGKSAYEIAVENGFEGTETEWLASLKGEDGVIGADGKSAYEIAVENGFEGTETEWLESIRGMDGATGSGSCDIDWDNPTHINVLSTLSSDTSNANLTHWIGRATVPISGVCSVHITIPSGITADNIRSSNYVAGFVNGNGLIYTPLRTGSNFFTIPSVREGDEVTAHVVWLKTASTAKPEIFSFTFYPYIDQNVDVFSTTETKTNKVWIDGKPIYRIVFTGTVTNSSGSVTTIQDITSLNIDTCLSINGTVKAKTTNSVISIVNIASNNYTSFYLNHSTDLVYTNTNTYLANSPYIVILEYTKTTD